MLKRLVAVLIITGFLVSIVVLTGCNKSTPYQPPYQPTPTQQLYQVNLVTPSQILGCTEYTYTPKTIQAGKTISMSWRADGNVNAYIFTETQFGSWKSNFGIGNYAASTSGTSGTLSYIVTNTDKYYFVIKNPLCGQSVKVYSATASW